jgi:hypothetical protein
MNGIAKSQCRKIISYAAKKAKERIDKMEY